MSNITCSNIYSVPSWNSYVCRSTWYLKCEVFPNRLPTCSDLKLKRINCGRLDPMAEELSTQWPGPSAGRSFFYSSFTGNGPGRANHSLLWVADGPSSWGKLESKCLIIFTNVRFSKHTTTEPLFLRSHCLECCVLDNIAFAYSKLNNILFSLSRCR